MRGNEERVKEMLMQAHAKINLSLDVTGKRKDGYHLLEMVMQALELHDDVVLEKIPQGILVQCSKPYVPSDRRNIAYKAAELMRDTYGIGEGVSIRIEKRIPVAAGLAGGSTDAAAVIHGMNRLFHLGLTLEEMMGLGLSIGADVPYCLVGGTALVSGIGERVRPLPSFAGHPVVLVKPPFGLSTKEIYGGFDLTLVKRHVETEQLLQAMEGGDLREMSTHMRNLLENVVLRKHRVLKSLKETLLRRGAVAALMSGSGPTVYGLFEDMETAANAAKAMNTNHNEVILTRTSGGIL